MAMAEDQFGFRRPVRILTQSLSAAPFGHSETRNNLRIHPWARWGAFLRGGGGPDGRPCADEPDDEIGRTSEPDDEPDDEIGRTSEPGGDAGGSLW
jgi:hypothetical protein